VFFRASTTGDALALIGKMFSPKAWYYGHHVSIKLAECFQLDELWYILKVTPIAKMSFGGYICMWLILALSAWLVFKSGTAKEISGTVRRTPLLMVIMGLLFVWCTISLGNVSTFLYVNF
jgi:alginate O-acetyltransferase complex protein AlgI